MVTYFRAPKQSNSLYGRTLISSIYNIRWPKHPHSPIRWYKQVPQVLTSRPCYMVSWLDTARIYTASTSTISSDSMSTASTPSLHQDPSHWRMRYPIPVPYLASPVPCYPPFTIWLKSLSPYWFDSPFPSWFDSPFPAWVNSLFLAWFVLLFLTWFGSRFLTRFDLVFLFGFTYV